MLVIAIHDHGVKVLGHDLLDRGEGLGAELNAKLKLAKHLAYYMGNFFIRTKEESVVCHTKAIVETAVRAIKLPQ